jgi:CHRD domain/PEP-CTERM motif
MKKTVLALAAAAFAAGAQAHLTQFEGTFAAEAIGATGTGTLYMEYDEDGHTLFIDADWSGLSGVTTTAHIHCCTAVPNTGTAGVALATNNILPGFPLGVSAGSYTRTIDLTLTTSYGGAFLNGSGGTAAGAEARLISNLASGNAYFNIHTSTFGGGEIRAFVSVVPEPETYALMLAGLASLGFLAQRRRSV